MTIASEQSERLLAIGQIQLPLQVEKLTAQSCFWRTNTEAEAKAQALAQATASLQAQIGQENQLLNEEVSYQLLEGGVWAATVRWECLEEIGERKR